MPAFTHTYSFDPTYGYELDELLEVQAPKAPKDFAEFWQGRYDRAVQLHPKATLSTPKSGGKRWQVSDLHYHSTGGFEIRGWALLPKSGIVKRGLICLHGYGGVDGPDLNLPFEDSVILFPCLRGIGRSKRPPISPDPAWHVLHDINNRDRYIHGGCVEDVWLGVSALLQLFPQVSGRIGVLGVSFGGGIGMLSIPWEPRISRAHFEVPSFGNYPLRLTLPTAGSGAAVNAYEKRKGDALETLRYYDAATAAQHTRVPVSIAAALFDPFVAPPSQFAIYNSLAGERNLFVLEAGHFDYPNAARQRRELLDNLAQYFSVL